MWEERSKTHVSLNPAYRITAVPELGWKGRIISCCEPARGHLESTEAKGEGCLLSTAIRSNAGP